MLGSSRHSRTFKVQVAPILKALHENRALHEKEYRIAVGDYCEAVDRVARRALVELSEGAVPDRLSLKKPESYLNAYDNAIGMLSILAEDTVELSADEYERFVRNNWDWIDVFRASTQVYKEMR